MHRRPTARIGTSRSILDSRSRVYGDELLYRSAQSDNAFSGRASQASARILAESIAGLDLNVLCDGRRAFLSWASTRCANGLRSGRLPASKAAHPHDGHTGAHLRDLIPDP